MELIEKDLNQYSPEELEILRAYYKLPESLTRKELIHAVAEMNTVKMITEKDMPIECVTTVRFGLTEAICIPDNQFSSWKQKTHDGTHYRIIPILGSNGKEKWVVDTFDKTQKEYRAVMIDSQPTCEMYIFLTNPEEELKKYSEEKISGMSVVDLMDGLVTNFPDVIGMIYSRVHVEGPIVEKVYSEFDNYQDIVNCLLDITDCMPETFSQKECIEHLATDVIEEFIKNAKIEHLETFIQAVNNLLLQEQNP